MPFCARMRGGLFFLFFSCTDCVARPSSKGKPTDPKLREKVKEEVKQETNKDGGGKGEWSAWKVGFFYLFLSWCLIEMLVWGSCSSADMNDRPAN